MSPAGRRTSSGQGGAALASRSGSSTPSLAVLASLTSQVYRSISRLHNFDAAGDEQWVEADLAAQVAALTDACEQGSVNSASSASLLDAETRLRTLDGLVRFHKGLESYDQYMRTGELVGASTTLCDLTTILNEFDSGARQLPDSDIYDIVKEEWLERKAALHFYLDDVFKAAYQIKNRQTSQATVQVVFRVMSTSGASFHDSPVSNDDLLLALDTAGLLESRMTLLLHDILRSFVVSQDAGLLFTARLQVVRNKNTATLAQSSDAPSEQAQSPHEAIALFLDRMLLLASFVAEHMFTPSFPPPSWLVERMAKGIFDETRRHVQHVMRVLDSKQQDMLDAIANTMVSFQESMQDKGLWSTECVSLSQYAYCLHRQHMALESGRVLSDALDILNTIETNVVPAPSLAYQQGTVGVAKSMPGKAGKNGANGIARSFETHGYKISQRTLLLAEAMTERLASLHLNGPKEDRYKTMQLLHATKNIVHLFHAQMASNGPENAAELRQNPMRAMAFYCNCLFVSQHLGLLGMHFLETCNDMSVNMTFADLIPHFLGEGEGVFLDHLRWIKESLQGDIDGIVSDNATESEEAVHQLVARLTGVAHAWQQVAPTELYAQSFGTLVDYVITSMAARLAGHELDASKRSTGGSRTYSLRYCASHLQSLEKVFVDLGQDAHAQPCDAGSAIGNGRVKGKKLPVHKFVPSWALLEKMAKE